MLSNPRHAAATIHDARKHDEKNAIEVSVWMSR